MAPVGSSTVGQVAPYWVMKSRAGAGASYISTPDDREPVGGVLPRAWP